MGAIQWPIKVEGFMLFDANGAYIGIGSDGHAAAIVEAANRGHKAMQFDEGLSSGEIGEGYACAVKWRTWYREAEEKAMKAEAESAKQLAEAHAKLAEACAELNKLREVANDADPRLSEVVAWIEGQDCDLGRLVLYGDGSWSFEGSDQSVLFDGDGQKELSERIHPTNPDAAAITTIRKALPDGTDERDFFERLLAERKGVE